MLFTFLIYFTLSVALSRSKLIAILFSRSSLLLYSCSCILINFTLEWHFWDKSNSIYNSLLYFDIMNIVLISFILFIVVIILLLTSYFPCILGKNLEEISLYVKFNKSKFREWNSNLFTSLLLQKNRDHYKIIEYPLIIQFIVMGGIMLLSCNDIVTIFLCIELQSYGLYILSSIYRNSESSTGAGLTYFLLGGLSSCIILLGQSLLYVNSGNTGLDGLYLIQNIIASETNYVYYTNILFQHLASSCFFFEKANVVTLDLYSYQILLSFIIVTVGFLFKISAAPFHSWSPAVYDAIPTVTTTFVAIIPKISILILLFDLAYHTGASLYDYSWTNILLFSSFLSLILGSVLGLTQNKIKRLYAYSTISHLGFILLALGIYSSESVQSFCFYIIQYSLSNINAFFILIIFGYIQVYMRKNIEKIKSVLSFYKIYITHIQDLSPLRFIDQIKGYIYLNPALVISLSVTLYSLIGIPPLVGFFAKQMILSSALDNGKIFLCIIAIITSVISAVYYLNIIKKMYFEHTFDQWGTIVISIENGKQEKIAIRDLTRLSNVILAIISILTFLSVFFIFLYYEIYFLTNIVSIVLLC